MRSTETTYIKRAITTGSIRNELRAQLPTHALHNHDATGPLSGALGLPTQTEMSLHPRQQNPKIGKQEIEIRKQETEDRCLVPSPTTPPSPPNA